MVDGPGGCCIAEAYLQLALLLCFHLEGLVGVSQPVTTSASAHLPRETVASSLTNRR